MVYLLIALTVVASAAVWGLRRAACFARWRGGDSDWLPDELRDADLMWSEKTFRCLGPVPMAVRIDRAYRARDGQLTLIEFKRRAVRRAYWPPPIQADGSVS